MNINESGDYESKEGSNQLTDIFPNVQRSNNTGNGHANTIENVGNAKSQLLSRDNSNENLAITIPL